MSFEPVDGKGVVYLYRLGRAVGAANATSIKVNSLEAGGTGPGTFFRWELKPGKYTFFASTGESSKTVAQEEIFAPARITASYILGVMQLPPPPGSSLPI